MEEEQGKSSFTLEVYVSKRFGEFFLVVQAEKLVNKTQSKARVFFVRIETKSQRDLFEFVFISSCGRRQEFLELNNTTTSICFTQSRIILSV